MKCVTLRYIKAWFLLMFVALLITSCALQGEPIAEPPEATNDLEETGVLEELPPSTLFVRPEPVDHPLANELLALVSEFTWGLLFPEFEDVQSIDFYPPEISYNLRQVVFFRNFDLLVADRGVPREEVPLSDAELREISTIRYDDMIAVGREFFGDDFHFAKGESGHEIVPVSDDPSLYISTSERGGGDVIFYFLIDIAEYGNVYIATFMPYWLVVSWHDQTVQSVGFFNPNHDPDFHITSWSNLSSS